MWVGFEPRQPLAEREPDTNRVHNTDMGVCRAMRSAVGERSEAECGESATRGERGGRDVVRVEELRSGGGGSMLERPKKGDWLPCANVSVLISSFATYFSEAF